MALERCIKQTRKAINKLPRQTGLRIRAERCEPNDRKIAKPSSHCESGRTLTSCSSRFNHCPSSLELAVIYLSFNDGKKYPLREALRPHSKCNLRRQLLMFDNLQKEHKDSLFTLLVVRFELKLLASILIIPTTTNVRAEFPLCFNSFIQFCNALKNKGHVFLFFCFLFNRSNSKFTELKLHPEVLHSWCYLGKRIQQTFYDFWWVHASIK